MRRRAAADGGVKPHALVALHQGAAGEAGIVTAASRQNRVFLPSPREPLRAVGRVGAESAGVGGCTREKGPPTPDPSPPLRFATRGEGGRGAAGKHVVSGNRPSARLAE